MSNPNRHRCPRCFYASDTETVCPAICCRGGEMEPAPDALLDGEIFTAESWDAQVEAERLLNPTHPERFVRPDQGFRTEYRQGTLSGRSTAMYSFNEGAEPVELDKDAAANLRDWK